MYVLKIVYEITQDLLTLTLPLTNSTTEFGGGLIASQTARLLQPDRKGQDTFNELTATTFRGNP